MLNWFWSKGSLKNLIKNKFKILNQFFLKILVQSVVQSFWKSPVLNCFQNSPKWFLKILVHQLWSKSWISSDSDLVLSSDQKSWIGSYSDCDPKFWKDWVESILILNSDQKVLVQSVVQRFFKKFLKRLSWIDSDQKSDQKSDQSFELVLIQIVVQSLLKWLESILIKKL